ncbi:hypothetical protein BX600DRAFT_515478 [Xylariales sp. PMI_506]|nr:hypothetical protein BX600DRAFT_515478 [Xylariales sp. PMI_506]
MATEHENADTMADVPPPYRREAGISNLQGEIDDAHLHEPVPAYTARARKIETSAVQANPAFSGRRRNALCVWLPMSLMVMTAIIVGVVVGTSNSKSATSNQGTSPRYTQSTSTYTLPTTTPLPENRYVSRYSKIAASAMSTNRSSSTSVFFQDIYGSLILLREVDKSGKWQPTNLTEQLSTLENPLTLIEGSSLTAASCYNSTCNQTTVWCVSNPSYNVLSINDAPLSSDSTGWQVNSVILAANGSNAAWYYPDLLAAYLPASDPNTVGAFSSLYLDVVQQYQFNNDIASASSAYTTPNIQIPNYLLALVPRRDNTDGDVFHLKMLGGNYSKTTDTVTMGSWTYTDGNWSVDPPLLSPTIDSSPPIYAYTMLNDFLDTYYVLQYENGSLSGWINGQSNNFFPSINISSGPPLDYFGFSDMAATFDGSFFGVYNDSIMAYSINSTDPSILNYRGVIYPIPE